MFLTNDVSSRFDSDVWGILVDGDGNSAADLSGPNAPLVFGSPVLHV